VLVVRAVAWPELELILLRLNDSASFVAQCSVVEAQASRAFDCPARSVIRPTNLRHHITSSITSSKTGRSSFSVFSWPATWQST
jgi:hypothetical protein